MKRLLLAVIALLAPSLAPAQELGRLFFTPEQRAALDTRRKARVPDRPAAPVVTSPTTRLDGYVKRSGGPSTVWVNGESVTEGAPEAPRIGSNEVSVPVGDGAARVRLRPGEVLDRGSGEVRDVLGDGEVQVRRRAR
jgi:hypothetical protein